MESKLSHPVLLMEKQVNTMQVDFSEKEPSQKYQNVLSCIIKSNLCDAIMYEHKMHVEYKISRLFERLILKSFHSAIARISAPLERPSVWPSVPWVEEFF